MFYKTIPFNENTNKLNFRLRRFTTGLIKATRSGLSAIEVLIDPYRIDRNNYAENYSIPKLSQNIDYIKEIDTLIQEIDYIDNKKNKQKIIDEVATKVCTWMNLPKVALYLYDKEDNKLVLKSAASNDDRYPLYYVKFLNFIGRALGLSTINLTPKKGPKGAILLSLETGEPYLEPDNDNPSVPVNKRVETFLSQIGDPPSKKISKNAGIGIPFKKKDQTESIGIACIALEDSDLERITEKLPFLYAFGNLAACILDESTSSNLKKQEIISALNTLLSTKLAEERNNLSEKINENMSILNKLKSQKEILDAREKELEAKTKELTKEKQEKQELEKKLDQLEKILEKTNKDRILKTIFHSLKGYLQTLHINKQNANETREKIKNLITSLYNLIKELDLKDQKVENIFEELFNALALSEEKNQLVDKAIFKSIPKYIHVNRERLNGNMILFSEEPVALSTVYSDTVDDFADVLKIYNITALPLKTHIRALKLQNIVDTSLHDILILLFTNAIEAFIQNGKLDRDKEIKCITSQGKKNNKTFTVVRFIDNGLGIPDALKEKIFERGFSTKKEQAMDNTLTDQNLGNSGIGLDDIKSYMEAIGGFIREVGIYGEGAEFQLWFPEENRAEADAAKEETAAVEQISELVHNKRILLAEDNDEIRESLANELRKFNLIVETASDGLHGYEMITKNDNYDLIITDIDMPDLKGNDMILKLYQNNHKIPFIFASDLFSEEKGLAFYNLRKPFRELGINEIPSFSKPLNLNTLILKVEEILLKTVESAAEEKN